jgi:hypothetical protein
MRWASAVISVVLLAGACGGERESLLQLDLMMPPTVAVQSVEVQVGSLKRAYAWEAAQPRPSVGLDVRVPRSISGEVPVLVSALDDRGCVVAAQSTIVQLRPGEKKQAGALLLAALATPDCTRTLDGGAEAGATDANGGATDAGRLRRGRRPGRCRRR